MELKKKLRRVSKLNILWEEKEEERWENGFKIRVMCYNKGILWK